MKLIVILVLLAGCVLTSMIAFADIISLGHAGSAPVVMLFLGFGLLGLAGVGRRRA